MTDAPWITFAQQRAAYEALGLDPKLFNRTHRVVITADTVTAFRFAVDDNAKLYVVNGEIAEEQVDVPRMNRRTRLAYAHRQRRRRGRTS